MNNPSNMTSNFYYNPNTNKYSLEEKIGSLYMSPAKSFSFSEYHRLNMQNLIDEYWNSKAEDRQIKQNTSLGLPKLYVPGKTFDRIFGGNTVDIRPQGSAELIFGLKINRLDNPSLPEEQRRTTSFDFQEKIQMNVIGKIGDKLKLTANFNTEATFDFENNMKLEYTGYEDEIIKKIEIGNVSLPLNGTLITGSQSLFGLKTQLQFGRLTLTGILSQQKSTTSEIEVTGGAQTSEFDIYADQYEANKHYFLSHYFKDKYDEFLIDLPFINSPVNITKVEVWITNKTGTTQDTRNVLSFLDLGEEKAFNEDGDKLVSNLYFSNGTGVVSVDNNQYPDNNSNSLYSLLSTGSSSGNNIILPSGYGDIRDINDVNNILNNLIPLVNTSFDNGRDYEKLERARKLSSIWMLYFS